MPGRRRRPAFRPAAQPDPGGVPTHRQTVVLVLVLVLVSGAIAVASVLVRPSRARSFDLFYGSMYLDSNTAPVAVDLATGKPSVRLTNAYEQVSAKTTGDLDLVPLTGGTLLLDTTTGEFNMLDSTGFVLKSANGGVALPNPGTSLRATGIAAGASAYIVRRTNTGTSVYLVGQSTVSAAAAGGKTRARASVSMSQPVRDVSTSAVSAAGASGSDDLWLLAGSGSTRTIRQLSVPAGSNAGATLRHHDHGTVRGVSAIEGTTRADAAAAVGANADANAGPAAQPTESSDADSVAIASTDGIDVFDAAGRAGHLRVRAPSGVDRILPASNVHGSFAFLYHSASGWSLVRARADATGHAEVTSLNSLTGTQLAPPAQSNSALYTMNRSSGALWRISSSGQTSRVSGAASYPLVLGERRSFRQGVVAARGTRVIFNSRANVEALTVFTDDSHHPVVVDKRTAVDLSANGEAALANAHGSAPPTKPHGATKAPKPNSGQPVTDRINCKNTTQIPHIPAVALIGTGSRSVQISWTYPLLDRRDCAPSTYTVSTQVAHGDAPSPPGTVRVQGVTGVNLTGLFPDTRYEIIVNAYINGRHTPSQPLLVRTQPEGPAAPSNLRVSADDQGHWQLRWNSCGGVAQGCVPVQSWTIIPQLCDSNGGLISSPTNGHLVGDPTTHTFTYTYSARAGLLGAGIRFTVEGVGDHGTIGDPASDKACVHSWAHPIASDIHVSASTPPHTAQGGTSHTRVEVTFSGNQAVALGGAGGQLTYRLASAGSVVNEVGPTERTTASLPGVQPGTAYQVQVVVAPPGHPTASVTLPSVKVAAAVADWPTLHPTASFTPDGGASSTGTLSVDVTGLSGKDAGGERFELADSSQLQCGDTAMPLSAGPLDLSGPVRFPHVDRSVFNGSCTVSFALREDPASITGPAYFGGTSSPTATAEVAIPVPELDTSAAQFVAQFVGGDQSDEPRIAVAYRGGNKLVAAYAVHWRIRAQYNAGGGQWTDCGSTSRADPARAPAELNLDMSCYYSHYNAHWRVTVDLVYFGQSPREPYDVAVNHSGPKPVDPARMSFTAKWSGKSVDVTYQGPYPDSKLSTLHWKQAVYSSHGHSCGSETQTPSTDRPMMLSVDFTVCPTDAGTPPPGSTTPPTVSYSAIVQFTDPNYGNSGKFTLDVSGAPS